MNLHFDRLGNKTLKKIINKIRKKSSSNPDLNKIDFYKKGSYHRTSEIKGTQKNSDSGKGIDQFLVTRFIKDSKKIDIEELFD